MSITLLLLVIAFILALLAAFGVSARGVSLGWLAFAVYVLAQLL